MHARANIMNPLYSEIRECIDSFVDDLARVVSTAIHEEVARELDRLSLTDSGFASPGRKKRTHSPARSGASNGASGERREKKGRGRKRSAEQLELALSGDEKRKQAAAEEAPPPAPPPLFVHKRTREGKIHHLSRAAGNGEEDTARQNGAANP
jgi:hypothetical protein